MANIKFSQFTSEAVDTDKTEIVGYVTGTTKNTRYTMTQLSAGVVDAYDQYEFKTNIFLSNAKVIGRDNGTTRNANIQFADVSPLGNPAVVVRDGGSDLMIVDGSGKVGIGVTDPDETLEIAGNVHVQGQSYSPIHTITYADPPVIDWNNGSIQTVTLTGSPATAIAAPSNPKDGATYVLIVKQDGTGGRTFAGGWNAVFKWKGGTAPTLSTGGNAVDIITFVCDGTNYYGVDSLNFS